MTKNTPSISWRNANKTYRHPLTGVVKNDMRKHKPIDIKKFDLQTKNEDYEKENSICSKPPFWPGVP